MNKFVLTLLLSVLAYSLNCMELSDDERETKSDLYDVMKVAETIDSAKDLFDLERCAYEINRLMMVDWVQVEKTDEILSYLGDLIIKKIRDHKLIEYDEISPIRLLF